MHRIKSLKTKPLIVAGCLPKAEKENVEKFTENASLLGPNSLGKTLDVINSTLSGTKQIALEDSDLSKVGLPKVRAKSNCRYCRNCKWLYERMYILSD